MEGAVTAIHGLVMQGMEWAGEREGRRGMECWAEEKGCLFCKLDHGFLLAR